MARVTIEDCEKVVGNRFDLVVLAAQRTRQILAGDALTVEGNGEKKPVIALREIAARTVSIDDLKEATINSFRSFLPEEEEEEDLDSLLEDDTYNPYGEISAKAVESENVSIVSEDEIEKPADALDSDG